MVDMGKLKWFLGIEFNISKDCITMDQSSYLKNILNRFEMQDCKPVKTPGEKLIFDENSDIFPSNVYKSAVGSMIYAMVATRPDLSYIVTKLSQFNNNPTEDHWKAVKRVLRYLKYTIDSKLYFRKCDRLSIIGYCDSDWASSEDRRSTTGYCFSLSSTSGCISWKSRRQPTVALSSTEAEYMALSAAVQEALYLKQLIIEMDPFLFNTKEPVIIWEDNQGAIALVKNSVHHQRTKHIDIRYHFIREQTVNNVINVKYMNTENMVADSLTKGVGKLKLEYCNNTLFGNMAKV